VYQSPPPTLSQHRDLDRAPQIFPLKKEKP
jgi:hypothetical protein